MFREARGFPGIIHDPWDRDVGKLDPHAKPNIPSNQKPDHESALHNQSFIILHYIMKRVAYSIKVVHYTLQNKHA